MVVSHALVLWGGSLSAGGRDTRRKRGGEEICELIFLAGGNLAAAL